ncbi:roquin-1-like isoform X2 [Littorina saxatilis]|uniref:roquin-1-like isoform X2 n=1 Tax=Littorina saxatilis TaxID=31220 RepID=UPI0038B63884
MSNSSESYDTLSHIDNRLNYRDHYSSIDKNNNSFSSEEAERAEAVFASIMPGQGPQWTEFLTCEVCYKFFSENINRPISLGCGHTVCKQCLSQLQQSKCPFDQSPINCDIDKLPVNYALLQLIGAAIPDKLIDEELSVGNISDAKKTECYESARKCIEELAVYLKALSEDSINELEKNNEDLSDLKVNKQGYHPPSLQTRNGRNVNTPTQHSTSCMLSRPMQRKLLVLINCQLVEEEGRSRAARAARSLGERSVTELILAHQNPQQLSANLWAAVRARGCQFLGPGMQEEVLRLILLALEDGSALSRKVLVLFVVQRLEKQYPQASKTAIGHVVQLLYRASCFKVTKREEESSLMQLKEEFRTYDTLRLEHDAQIVEIAMEAGLRISPEQWSSLLYGDALHKSHMQSIIDKHQSPQSFTQGINEMVLVLQRLGDPCNLNRLRPHLDFLAKIDPSPDCPAPSWEDLEAVMKSLKIVVQGLVDFVKRFNHRRPEIAPPQNTRYKTSMCRDFLAKGSCPRDATCTFAHSQDELEQYRCRSKKLNQRGGVGGPAVMAVPARPRGPEMFQAEDPALHKPDLYHDHSMDIGDGGNNLGMLIGPMAGMSISPPQPPDPGQPPNNPPWPLAMAPQPQGPPAIIPIIPPGMPVNHPAVHMPLAAAPNIPEGMSRDQIPGGFPPGISVRFQPPSDIGIQYHNAAINPNVPQPLPPGGPPSNMPQVPRPPLPPPGIHPNLQARVVEMVAQGAPCIHQQVPGVGPVYPMGQMVAGAMQTFTPEAFVCAPGPDIPTPMVPMQTLEKLRNRKSRLISHLQHECSAPVSNNDLDRVLSTSPHPAVSRMPVSVKDSLVATRTTHTLDELESEHLTRYQLNQGHHTSQGYAVGPPPQKMMQRDGPATSVEATNYSSRPEMNQSSRPEMNYSRPEVNYSRPEVNYSRPEVNYSSRSGNTSTSASSYRPYVGASEASGGACGDYPPRHDLAEDGQSDDADYIGMHMSRMSATSLDDEDDFFIPFDPPLVSRFGPINRVARIKGGNTAPVQVTAEETIMLCTPVLSLQHRPYPTSALVPSMYTPQMTACPAPSMATPLQPAPTNMYSPWGGLDFWRRQIPEIVHNLETSAIQANTTTERLALELQSVELQISMKTGENPKLVSLLLQEAVPGDRELKDTTQSIGKMYGTGEDTIRQQNWNDFNPEWK